MPFVFGNAASTVLQQTANGAPTPDTTITVTNGAVFPPLAVGQSFRIAIEDAAGQLEYCDVTDVTGNQLTVTRAVEEVNGASTALTFQPGAIVELRLTAETLDNFAQLDGATFTGDVTLAGTTTFTGAATVSGNTIWHEGNDGPGSTLDADTVDGYHGADFAAAAHNHDADYAPLTHDHDADYAAINHGHTTLELGAAQTDTTLSRKAAGVLAVENRAVFTHSDTSINSAKVTFSTSAPSGGAGGDIWFRYS